MRNKTRTNGKTRPSRSNRKSNNRKSGTACRKTPRGTSPQYTDAQREQIQTGLRILARMIARAHLRRQADRVAPESPPDPDTGG